MKELNVKNLTTTTDKEAYSVTMKAKADTKALGIRLRQQSGPVVKEIEKLTSDDLQLLEKQGMPV